MHSRRGCWHENVYRHCIKALVKRDLHVSYRNTTHRSHSRQDYTLSLKCELLIFWPWLLSLTCICSRFKSKKLGVYLTLMTKLTVFNTVKISMTVLENFPDFRSYLQKSSDDWGLVVRQTPHSSKEKENVSLKLFNRGEKNLRRFHIFFLVRCVCDIVPRRPFWLAFFPQPMKSWLRCPEASLIACSHMTDIT